jgi:hypothetical protein
MDSVESEEKLDDEYAFAMRRLRTMCLKAAPEKLRLLARKMFPDNFAKS